MHRFTTRCPSASFESESDYMKAARKASAQSPNHGRFWPEIVVTKPHELIKFEKENDE